MAEVSGADLKEVGTLGVAGSIWLLFHLFDKVEEKREKRRREARAEAEHRYETTGELPSREPKRAEVGDHSTLEWLQQRFDEMDEKWRLREQRLQTQVTNLQADLRAEKATTQQLIKVIRDAGIPMDGLDLPHAKSPGKPDPDVVPDVPWRAEEQA